MKNRTGLHSNEIVLVSVVDKHLAMMQAALLQSIQHNHKSSEKIIFYIVDDNLTSSVRQKIENGVDRDKIIIEWLKIDDVLYKRINLSDDKSLFPINVYARLFAPFFLPASCTKAIYLDVDMICCVDISELWNIDMKDKPVAGVVDRAGTFNSKWAGIQNYKELGYDGKTEYFNSGMFIMDIPKWREMDATHKIIKIIKENKKFASFPINYGMNVFFVEQWHKLNPAWNTYATDEMESPYIIHFVNRKPIYKSYKFNEFYKDIFYKYLDMTAWRGFKPIGELRRLAKKIYVVLEKKIKTFN